MSGNSPFYKIEKSAIVTFIGIVFLFSFSIAIVLIMPRHIDPSWSQPTSPYQVQMYEVADPHLYISSSPMRNENLQYVYHVKNGYSLLAFNEEPLLRIVAPPDLEKYITQYDDQEMILTARLLLLRAPQTSKGFDAVKAGSEIQEAFWQQWEKENEGWQAQKKTRPSIKVLELYDPQQKEVFVLGPSETITENWIDSHYTLLDASPDVAYHRDPGVIYINNPQEYRLERYTFAGEESWRYSPTGQAIASVDDLKSLKLGFRSRQELIALGEHIYAIEGCWYCHTDQTRTLVQEVVLNGSDSYPAPPSSPNEYIYQKITFPGTRRIGPDLSRTGVKRPSRDWHKGHFWAPKTASQGSVMPAFQHFFDSDPRGTGKMPTGNPNYRFEAIFQYMMTKGTRITSPNHAWWIGKDPVQTKKIIQGEKQVVK